MPKSQMCSPLLLLFLFLDALPPLLVPEVSISVSCVLIVEGEAAQALVGVVVVQAETAAEKATGVICNEKENNQ